MNVGQAPRLPPSELAVEHGVLMRQLGGLQRRTSELLDASTQRVAALERENLRLRAELILMRTALCWGLGAGTLLRRPSVPRSGGRSPPRGAMVAEAPEAQTVICRTGCAGHAHPWLEPDGQCRRLGTLCEAMGESSARS